MYARVKITAQSIKIIEPSLSLSHLPHSRPLSFYLAHSILSSISFNYPFPLSPSRAYSDFTLPRHQSGDIYDPFSRTVCIVSVAHNGVYAQLKGSRSSVFLSVRRMQGGGGGAWRLRGMSLAAAPGMLRILLLLLLVTLLTVPCARADGESPSLFPCVCVCVRG